MAWTAPKKEVYFRMPETMLFDRIAADASRDLGRIITGADIRSVGPDPDDSSFWRLTLKDKDDT